ncbi:MAG TPA: DUF2332 domain-containing protein [Candidatus Acidoferrales bacterium]|nr:DUF2332 domain-containing protein [Candidatus Acidoferrales bacterium]
MIDASLERNLERQIEAFALMRSSLYARIAGRVLANYREGGVVRDFFAASPARASASTPGVRLMGALHYLALRGEAPELAAHFPSCGGDGDDEAIWKIVEELLVSRRERIGELYAETPQTNEVLRATVLSAGLRAFARNTSLPLRLFEIGASAGLNTRIVGGDCVIAERGACDLHPLDIEDERDRMRLLSFVWADDAERIERLHQAIEIARASPLVVEQADMFEWLPRRVSPKANTATVVMQSVVADHLTKEERARLAGIIGRIGESAQAASPFAWLRMEFDRPTRRYHTRLRSWPGGEDVLIASSTGHARDIEWIN